MGPLQPTWVKALVIDSGKTKFCFVTVDSIGKNDEFALLLSLRTDTFCAFTAADGTLRRMAWERARDMGFSIPLDNMTLHGSHTHSGPGGISPHMLWQLAPATDLLVPGSTFLISLTVSDLKVLVDAVVLQ